MDFVVPYNTLKKNIFFWGEGIFTFQLHDKYIRCIFIFKQQKRLKKV